MNPFTNGTLITDFRDRLRGKVLHKRSGLCPGWMGERVDPVIRRSEYRQLSEWRLPRRREVDEQSADDPFSPSSFRSAPANGAVHLIKKFINCLVASPSDRFPYCCG